MKNNGKLGKGAMNGEIKDWVSREFKTLSFNSKRLESRFQMVKSDLTEQPEKSIWLASGSRANAKAVYRMLANFINGARYNGSKL